MTGFRRPGLGTRNDAAWLAVLVGAVCALLHVATADVSDPAHHSLLPTLVLDLGALAGAAVAARVVDWDARPREALLVFPAAGCVASAGLGFAAPHASAAWAGMLVVAFVYAGLTQRRGLSLVVVPFAVLAWISLQDRSFDGQLLVRLVIAMVLWTGIAEVLAWKSQQNAAQRDLLLEWAHQDALTGLENRHALPMALAAHRPETALVMIDIDHFKQVNDSLGHQEGDRILQSFADVLGRVLRAGDSAYRYGGEEFLVIAVGAGVEGAERLLGRVTAAWRATQPDVTFSAGVALWAEGEAGDTALRRADHALYGAKAAGRDRWLVAADTAAAAPVPEVPRQTRTVLEPDAVSLTHWV